MSTNVQKLSDRLFEILTRKEPLAVTINGAWGTGKTYFWDKFSKDKLEGKKIAYVSLFGKDSLQDIRKEIILQISVKDKHLSDIKEKIQDLKSTLGLKETDFNIGLSGSFLSVAISLFEKKDFENVIVCFDDFERMSDKLRAKDILGLISELKEQKKCNVVMILNKDKLGDKKASLDDKIIDYEFLFDPTPSESYMAVKDCLKAFTAYPEEYFNDKNITNIRIMKRVINALNDFAFIEESLEKHRELEKEIVQSIIEFSAIYAINPSVNFKTLASYETSKSLKQKDTNQPSNEELEYDKLLKLRYVSWNSIFWLGDLAHIIDEYVKGSIINEGSFKSIVETKKLDKDMSEILAQIRNCIEKRDYSLTYEYKQYTNDLFEILENNKDNIHRIVSNIDDFISIIQSLKEYNQEQSDKYHSFAIQTLKVFLDSASDEKQPMYGRECKIGKIMAFDPLLRECYNSQKKLFEKIDSKEKIIHLMANIMAKPMLNRGFGEEPELLSLVKIADIEKYLFDAGFLEYSVEFVKWLNSYVNEKYFEDYKKNLLEAMHKIKETGDSTSVIKITKILDQINIETE